MDTKCTNEHANSPPPPTQGFPCNVPSGNSRMLKTFNMHLFAPKTYKSIGTELFR